MSTSSLSLNVTLKLPIWRSTGATLWRFLIDNVVNINSFSMWENIFKILAYTYKQMDKNHTLISFSDSSIEKIAESRSNKIISRWLHFLLKISWIMRTTWTLELVEFLTKIFMYFAMAAAWSMNARSSGNNITCEKYITYIERSLITYIESWVQGDFLEA